MSNPRPRVGDQIETTDQLEALPVGSVVLSDEGRAWQSENSILGLPIWYAIDYGAPAKAVVEHDAPLTVLHVPGEQPRTPEPAPAGDRDCQECGDILCRCGLDWTSPPAVPGNQPAPATVEDFVRSTAVAVGLDADDAAEHWRRAVEPTESAPADAITRLPDAWQDEADQHTRDGEFGIAEGLRTAAAQLTEAIRAAATPEPAPAIPYPLAITRVAASAVNAEMELADLLNTVRATTTHEGRARTIEAMKLVATAGAPPGVILRAASEWLAGRTQPAPATVEQAARVIALTDDYDGCFERMGTDEEMGTDSEDCEFWRRRAQALAAAGLLRTPVTAEQLTHDEDTLRKVYDALERVGLPDLTATNAVNAMLDAGILFRERAARMARGGTDER